MTDPAQKLQQASKLCARNPPCVRTADTCITYCENARILRREKARPANGAVAAAQPWRLRSPGVSECVQSLPGEQTLETDWHGHLPLRSRERGHIANMNLVGGYSVCARALVYVCVRLCWRASARVTRLTSKTGARRPRTSLRNRIRLRRPFRRHFRHI